MRLSSLTGTKTQTPLTGVDNPSLCDDGLDVDNDARGDADANDTAMPIKDAPVNASHIASRSADQGPGRSGITHWSPTSICTVARASFGPSQPEISVPARPVTMDASVFAAASACMPSRAGGRCTLSHRLGLRPTHSATAVTTSSLLGVACVVAAPTVKRFRLRANLLNAVGCARMLGASYRGRQLETELRDVQRKEGVPQSKCCCMCSG